MVKAIFHMTWGPRRVSITSSMSAFLLLLDIFTSFTTKPGMYLIVFLPLLSISLSSVFTLLKFEANWDLSYLGAELHILKTRSSWPFLSCVSVTVYSSSPSFLTFWGVGSPLSRSSRISPIRVSIDTRLSANLGRFQGVPELLGSGLLRHHTSWIPTRIRRAKYHLGDPETGI